MKFSRRRVFIITELKWLHLTFSKSQVLWEGERNSKLLIVFSSKVQLLTMMKFTDIGFSLVPMTKNTNGS